MAPLHPGAEVPPDASSRRSGSAPRATRSSPARCSATSTPADLRAGRPGQRLPAGLRGVLRHRLGQLPDDTRAALSAAAVLGREVELARLGHLLEEREERVVGALEQAVAQRVPGRGRAVLGRGYAFPHDLMREAVYAEIPVPRRQRLHQRAVDAVLGSHPADADVIAAAGHVLEAGPAADPVDAAALVDRAGTWPRPATASTWPCGWRRPASPLLRRYAPPAQQAAADVDVARLRFRAGRGLRPGRGAPRAGAGHLPLARRHRGRRAGAQPARGDARRAAPRHGRRPLAGALRRGRADGARRPGTRSACIAAGSRPRCTPWTPPRWRRAVERCAAIAEASGRPELSVVADWGRGWLALDLGRPDRGTCPPRGCLGDRPGASATRWSGGRRPTPRR